MSTDLKEIKEELVSEGYIRAKKKTKDKKQGIKKSKPLYFVSSDGHRNLRRKKQSAK